MVGVVVLTIHGHMFDGTQLRAESCDSIEL